MDTYRKDIHNSEIPVVCRACEARHGGVCGTLTPRQLTELSRQSTRRNVSAGTDVISQGERANTYSNIIRGVVKLSKMMADGRQQIVGLQFAPDFMGRPFTRDSALTAQAATETDICAFPRSLMDKLISETPDLEHRLHEQALKELEEARDWMLTLGRKSAQEKVASFLYLIATHIDPESVDSCSFDLPLSRADIADFLGLTIETVSRQITRLRKENVIRVENNRHVTVPDMDRLAYFAGSD
ncbi:Crp/Fnr family transcriptional regulator [Rhizobium sp. CFBP 8762]|uniref:Crp/Fnr family transcriptional regulator n=1 Tax=Rhizobium sp. CFBP 8762 TaxID=2775279 RepID=UPI001783C52C|nr:Crp/Fnr family transcriptional regulator [Rhizobium sp. CFBP 8762]MBD8554730.1 Crp/Fnr family transcriptional regulator [Rhizobium sp. CFBP 8762]